MMNPLPSVRVPELSIFSVRSRVPRRLTHEGFLPYLHPASSSVSSSILPTVVSVQYHCDHRTARLCAHHRKLRGPVVRCVLGLECLRSNDVANTEGARYNSGSKCTLCRSGDIRCCPSVENREGCDNSVDKIDSSEAASAVGHGEEGHQRSANDGRNDANDYPEPAVGLLADAEAHKESEEGADHAGGHIHQSCTLRHIA